MDSLHPSSFVVLMSCKGLPPNAPIAPYTLKLLFVPWTRYIPLNLSSQCRVNVLLMSCKGLPPNAPIAPYTLKLLFVPWTRYIPLNLSC